MRKVDRQRLLRNLIQTHEIERQEDFVKLLQAEQIEVTQATISRDIKEMQLVKVPNADEGYHYSLPLEKKLDVKEKLRRTLRDAYVTHNQQDYFVVIKAHPGNAPAIASLLDQLQSEDIFGTIGGDDTVLIICKSEEQAKQFRLFIEDLLK
ncbi:arginine repressor [Latilactobacillus sakei]|uniref:arginine repressor n=1 Tax=Latilactobacillus sakei TaxID=1599 RepID=UPI000CD6A507|nr:arginine repressor [Latilactobacillus sakei]AUX11565.1 arginine repressor [Latilactobacillus sakei]